MIPIEREALKNMSNPGSLIQLRRMLHAHPEVAGEENGTAERILDFFTPLKPDQTLQKLGGTGLAFVFKGKRPGKRLMFRCELDALPIQETGNPAYKSQIEGKAHLCGHDGHMAILCGLGEIQAQNRPEKGEIVLLFQPAEETGDGARAILNDPRFEQIKPDFAFALHNLPGYPLHQVVMRKETFAAGSTGMTIRLTGKTSHSAHPEAGLNPAQALAELIRKLPELPKEMEGFCLITLIHAELGNLAFGTSPGKANLSMTLRAFDQQDLDQLIENVKSLAMETASRTGLKINFDFVEQFAVSVNDSDLYNIVEKTALDLGLSLFEKPEPFRWSEDFGLFSQICPSFLFGLGAGDSCPQLHEGTYDFPDELIETGKGIFERIIKEVQA
ncbi:amidohydrolase [Algoriphagus sp. CAU 1675]|uniref:amidohydrolase n=1 Tax=Algoriphagus sp. CAU 1675 TaxID=3032597 RepID=UPI0023DB07FB|nr:amidohydrolase [Algoriphagus sp. CAU 1675]MDF2156256.1 amidohydrolase [Algoriphagus sp. CAU 1675]